MTLSDQLKRYLLVMFCFERDRLYLPKPVLFPDREYCNFTYPQLIKATAELPCDYFRATNEVN